MQKLIIRSITWLAMLLLMGALSTLSPMHALAQDGPPAEEPTARLFEPSSLPIPPFIPGIVAVGMRGDLAAASATLPNWGEIEVLAVEPLDLRTGEVSAASVDEVAAEPLTGYKLTVPVGTEWAVIEALMARGDVAFAEPDWLAQIAQVEPAKAAVETPFAIADTLYREQWYIQRIGTSRAWALALDESEGHLSTTVVVVIDTGVDSGHPDLANKLSAGRNYLNNAKTPMDDNGHGTHVSGLIAAAVNGAGMVGSGLQVELIPYKALDHNGTGGVTGIGQAIRDAADEGADIINLSLELSIDTFVLRSAIQYAVSEGVLVVAASGNHARTSVSYPAAYPSVLAVGASTYLDARAYYSNRGAALDIMAPGGLTSNSILSSWTSDVGAACPSELRQANGGLYCEAEGTSMATGVVSGVAALIMSLRPDLDADEVQEILLDTAFPIAGTTEEVGRGRVDAAKAVRLALEPRLVYAQDALMISSSDNGAPFVAKLTLTNPSLEPLTVEVVPTISTTWSSVLEPRGGEVSYGKPLDVQLIFTPTSIGVGTFQSGVRVTTTTEGGGTSVYVIDTLLEVRSSAIGESRMFLSWIGGLSHFVWAEPDYTERTNYTISGEGSIVVDLPFTVTVNQRRYTDLRIFADGFVVASASAFPLSLPNRCLANQIWPTFSVYGWWSDLGVGVDSTLSTFQPDANHFVIEYNHFVPMGSSNPDDRVSFQIVLSRSGQIELHYEQVPNDAPESVTIGASVDDGRFYNQITCFQAGTTQIGEVPQSHQSFIFNTQDLY